MFRLYLIRSIRLFFMFTLPLVNEHAVLCGEEKEGVSRVPHTVLYKWQFYHSSISSMPLLQQPSFVVEMAFHFLHVVIADILFECCSYLYAFGRCVAVPVVQGVGGSCLEDQLGKNCYSKTGERIGYESHLQN